jgi:hypothetical protein
MVARVPVTLNLYNRHSSETFCRVLPIVRGALLVAAWTLVEPIRLSGVVEASLERGGWRSHPLVVQRERVFDVSERSEGPPVPESSKETPVGVAVWSRFRLNGGEADWAAARAIIAAHLLGSPGEGGRSSGVRHTLVSSRWISAVTAVSLL